RAARAGARAGVAEQRHRRDPRDARETRCHIQSEHENRCHGCAGECNTVSESADARDAVGFGVFVPVLLILFALIVQAAADHVELRTTRSQLDAQYTKQTEPLDEAQKLRSQLQAIAGDTALLAEQGNPNAIK